MCVLFTCVFLTRGVHIAADSAILAVSVKKKNKIRVFFFLCGEGKKKGREEKRGLKGQAARRRRGGQPRHKWP